MLGLPSAVLAQVEIFWVGPAEFSYPEPWPNVIVNVGLTGPAPGPVSVHYEVQEGGTAEYGTHYWGVAGTLVWAEGENQVQAISIPLIDDDIAEPTEDFFMVLDTAVGAGITEGDSVQRIIILDDDGGGTLPRATLVGPSDNLGDIQSVFCDEPTGETVVCGVEYEIRYIPTTSRIVRVVVTPAPSDTVTFDVEIGGGITSEMQTVADSSSDEALIEFQRGPQSGLYVYGWIRIMPQGGIEAPGPSDFHEANIIIEPNEFDGQSACAACMLQVFMFGRCGETWDYDGTVICDDGTGEESIKRSGESDLELFRRYRDEVLAGDTASDLSALRTTAGLDALTGQTVAAAQTAFADGAALPLEASTWGSLKAQFR